MRDEEQHAASVSSRFARMAGMRQTLHEIIVTTRGKGLYDFTSEVRGWVKAGGIRDGLLTLYIRHTSASLLIQENYDPTVQTDLERFLSRLVPEGDPIYEHTLEGADDMPAHVRAALTQTHLAIPVAEGNPLLGTWQGVYVFEHRRAAQERSVVLHLMGE
jgi:secondary thiamine-phosphate synthase enzyme